MFRWLTWWLLVPESGRADGRSPGVGPRSTQKALCQAGAEGGPGQVLVNCCFAGFGNREFVGEPSE